jgi:hypothetical protein
MSMNTWTPLWSQVVESTLWEEPLPVRVLFLTMLAIKEPDHVVRMRFGRLCKKANIEPDVCAEALRVLMEPDGKSLDEQPFEGRRGQEVEGGWLILNGEHYQREVQRLLLRAKKTAWQREQRQKDRDAEIAKAEARSKKALKSGTPLAGETAAVKAMERGDEAEADRLAAQGPGGNGSAPQSESGGSVSRPAPAEEPESIPLGPREPEE